jgi:single-strand DNA-binding protein
MAYSINKVTLLGNVGKDPEIRTFQNGGKVANFTLATSESWKDKTTGEKKTATEWHNVVLHGDGLVGLAEKYIKKGSKLHIEGKLETRKWEKDGATRYTTEIVLRPYGGELVLLDAKDAPADEAPPSE